MAPEPGLGVVIGEQRLDRLRSTMAAHGVGAVLTADPIDVFYATGVRNMTIFSLMGPSRFALVTADRVVVWEYAGSEHLAERSPVTDVRTAPGLTPLSGPAHAGAVDAFAREVRELTLGCGPAVAIERFEMPVVDRLRERGIQLTDATSVFAAARSVKMPTEVDAMWASMRATEAAVEAMRPQIRAGRTEVEVWSHFHRRLIAADGEYVSTRLVQSGERTFPYFQEASTKVLGDGDLFCIDTDAVGPGGYAADFSRTFVCGDVEPTVTQRRLHETAMAQLDHNAGLLEPGRSFESFAAQAFVLPQGVRPYGYPCLAHGLGLCGEYPYIPTMPDHGDYPLPGEFEVGMVICVESYIGSPTDRCGVKLEDQYLLTDDGPVPMSRMDRGLVPGDRPTGAR